MTRSSNWYQEFFPCDLDHLWNLPLSGAFVFHKHILFFVYPCIKQFSEITVLSEFTAHINITLEDQKRKSPVRHFEVRFQSEPLPILNPKSSHV